MTLRELQALEIVSSDSAIGFKSIGGSIHLFKDHRKYDGLNLADLEVVSIEPYDVKVSVLDPEDIDIEHNAPDWFEVMDIRFPNRLNLTFNANLVIILKLPRHTMEGDTYV